MNRHKVWHPTHDGMRFVCFVLLGDAEAIGQRLGFPWKSPDKAFLTAGGKWSLDFDKALHFSDHVELSRFINRRSAPVGFAFCGVVPEPCSVWRKGLNMAFMTGLSL